MTENSYQKYYLPGDDYRYGNFRQFIDSIAEKYGKNTAIRMRGSDREYRQWSFDRLKKETASLASYLASKGLKPGDRVGILSENRPEWCISYLASLYSGLVAVPLDSLMDSGSLEKIASFAEIRALFYSDKLKDKASGIIAPGKQVSALNLDDAALWGEMISFAGPSTVYDAPPETLAVIIFTSGTTGLSKGVMLSHGGILENVNASLKSFEVLPGDNVIVVLPLHHSYPTTQSFLSPLMAGASITIAEKLVGAKIIANIRETGGTQIVAVPLLFDKIKKAVETGFDSQPVCRRTALRVMLSVSRFLASCFHFPAGKLLFRKVREKAGIGTVRFMVSGGGPLSKETACFFDAFGCSLVQGYGLSENSPVVTSNTVKRHRNDSIGFPVKGTLVRIADPDSSGVGEIQVKSPSFMLGYYKNPDATREAFTDDGWLRTGDLGKLKRGYLYLSGRLKNIIVTSSGKNIYPEETEAEFATSETVAEVMIIGKESRKGCGIDMLAAVCYPDYEYIKRTHGKDRKDRDFIRQLLNTEVAEINKRLPSYRKISQVIIREEEFEKTSSLKIKRFLYTSYQQ